jgi:hypothetical protein
MEMGPAVFVDEIKDGRSAEHKGLASFHLAVKDPEGIGFSPSPAIRAQGRLFVEKVGSQFVPETGPALRASQRIDLKGKTAQTDRLDEVHAKDDDFRIRLGTRVSEDLRIDLVELPEAALLGPFVPEHGPDGKELLNGVVFIKTVLDVGPDQGSRGFRPEAHALSLAVREGIHLLGHNIGFFADAPAEELRQLEKGGHDLLEAEGAKNLPCFPLELLPRQRL